MSARKRHRAGCDPERSSTIRCRGRNRAARHVRLVPTALQFPNWSPSLPFLDALLGGFLRCVNNSDRVIAVAVDLYQWNSVVGSDLRKRVEIEIICRAGTALPLA